MIANTKGYPMRPNECARIIASHPDTVRRSTSADDPPWKGRHIVAWENPRSNGERAVKLAIEAYAAWADDYNESFEDSGGIGLDGYFGEHALNLLRTIHESLTMGFKTRFDSGAISRLVHDLARTSGVDPDQI